MSDTATVTTGCRLIRATVMFAAGDVRIEDVPGPRHRRADRRDRPGDRRLHLRQRPVALRRMERSEAGQSMGHEAIGVIQDVGADVRTLTGANW
jgi:threonine dehydrogenase-like Zn-dependent dehydrogenase